MLDSETKRRIDSCRDILVGKVPDPKSQVEQITIALIYKFMDDMDAEAEDLGGKRSFFTGEFAKYGWSNLMAPGMGGFDMLSLYSEAIGKMNENPGVPALFRDIFKNAYLPYRDPETLRGFLKEINGFTYDHSERLGDAFEYLLSVLGSQGDAGQFRTPRHIIDFMVELIDPKKDESILDPACGTAGFLISSYKHILKHNTKGYKAQQDREAFDETGVPLEALTLDSPLHYKGDLLTPDDKKRLAANIRGYDISPDMVRLSLVNMYLHGFASPHIDEYDTLTSDEKWNELADIILANPPFMSPKGGIKPHKRFSVAATRSEVLFVDYIAEHLTPNGRAAVIVPEGIIFQGGNAYKQLREMLVKHYLVAVISLPAGVFNPYSGVKTSILVMDKRLAKKTDAILFAKIGSDGYHLGAQRRPVDHNDLPAAVRAIKAWLDSARNGAVFNVESIANLSLVAKEKIGGNGEWNLSGERYREKDQLNHLEYEWISIGSVCELINGRAFKPEDWEKQESGGIPIVRIQNLNNLASEYNYYTGEVSEKHLIQRDELLFSWSGSRGTSFGAHMWRGQKAVLNQHIFKVLFDESKVTKKYLYYALNRAVTTIEENLHGGVGLVHITKGNLEKIKIPLPSLEVQKNIVAEIDGYQKIIDGARQVIENYQPRIFIEHEWQRIRIGDLFRTRSGTTPRRDNSAYFEGGCIPWVKTLDLTDGPVRETDEKITELALKVTNLEILPKGTVLIAMYGGFNQIGRSGVLEIEAAHNQAMTALLPSDKVEPYFLNAILISSKEYWKSVANSTRKDPNITKSDVLNFELPLPDIEIQRAIVTQLEAEQRLVNTNKELIRLFEDKIKAVINRVWGEAA